MLLVWATRGNCLKVNSIQYWFSKNNLLPCSFRFVQKKTLAFAYDWFFSPCLKFVLTFQKRTRNKWILTFWLDFEGQAKRAERPLLPCLTNVKIEKWSEARFWMFSPIFDSEVNCVKLAIGLFDQNEQELQLQVNPYKGYCYLLSGTSPGKTKALSIAWSTML